MRRLSRSCVIVGMSSYAVVWKLADDAPVAGRLELDPSGVTLAGGGRGAERRVELPLEEIVGLDRATERVRELPALRLEGRSFGTVLIAAFGAAGLNSEILEQLQIALANVL